MTGWADDALMREKLRSEQLALPPEEPPYAVCALCGAEIFPGEFYLELDGCAYCGLCVDAHTRLARWL